MRWNGAWPMSALGQKQTHGVQNGMSASPPIATAKADPRKWPCPLYRESGHSRSLGERGNGGLRDLPAPLLDEVTAVWDLERRGTPAYLLTQCCHHSRTQYWVFHPDSHERLPAPLTRPPLSGSPRDFDTLHLGRHHHQFGKAPYAGLVARVGKRRGVGFGFRFAQYRRGTPHQTRNVEVGIGFDIGFPIVEAGTWTCPYRNRCVHHQQTLEPLRHFHRQGETQESTPVLHDERDVLKIKPFDQPQQHVSVKTKRVDRIL